MDKQQGATREIDGGSSVRVFHRGKNISLISFLFQLLIDAINPYTLTFSTKSFSVFRNGIGKEVGPLFFSATVMFIGDHSVMRHVGR